MKTTAALALCALTLTVAGCTTTDETPPGGDSALAEEEASNEDEGIPAEGEGEGSSGEEEGSSDEAETTGEAGGGEDTGEKTGAPGGQSGASDLPDPESMDDEICVAFFEGAAPLAAAVQDGRRLVARGQRTALSEVEFMQVDVLAERLDELSNEAPNAQGALLTSIAIPFTEVGRAAEEGGTDAETGEVSYDSIEMGESEEAQKEFTSECTSSAG